MPSLLQTLDGGKHRKNKLKRTPTARPAPIAPTSLHPPVNRLHSIENQTDKSAYFLLT
jgi:hypothetical protein